MYNDKKINHTISAAQLVFIPALEQIFFLRSMNVVIGLHSGAM